MSKIILKNEEFERVLENFSKINLDDYPDFYSYKSPLDRGLWVLWVSKEELNTKVLTSEQIASIIREVLEISINSSSIQKSFNRAKDRIHTYKLDTNILYEIMMPGKEYLKSKEKNEYTNILYFEPEKRFSSKRILSKNILQNLEGDLKMVDPYCGVKTLDILIDIDDKIVNFLTRLDNLRSKDKSRFLRYLTDFKKERPMIEFRDYPNSELHDRYILSEDKIVIIGHSIKDLGKKETFAISMNNKNNKNIFQSLLSSFNRRWNNSTPI